ncbi:hypothetical protein FDO65_17735 [Nakamurella flava]|uniref:HTH luxR-type domain-containing protein n=1 Tax=Nakamurella flava TaxID=2576308 RepID=A0A4V6CT23_9ACTN|nr:LuxR family transcriptional regulator [Nakamurella flava]TKV57365.1 hypothetical protein FDO65_17735 [Nakamurella flava]
MSDRPPPRGFDAAAGGLSRDRIAEMVQGWVDGVVAGPPPAVPRPGDRPLRRGVSVSIEAPPGMGKSHLAWSVAERARDLGARVVTARGRERLSRSSFGVVDELVGGTAAARDPGDGAFEQIDAWTAQGPVLCWVDDLHWADSASLTVLRRLAWAGRDLPLVLLLTGRAAPSREAVSLVTRSVDHRVDLPPMTDMAVEALARDQLGGWPGPRLRRHLQRCRGNPLFVTDVLAGLTTSGRVGSVGRDRVDLIGPPPSAGAGLQTQLDDHLRQVGETPRELLAALAAWGTPASTQELADLLYVTPPAIHTAVEAALASGVVQWSDVGVNDNVSAGTDPRLQFVHDLYAERALALLDPTVLRSTHRRAATLRATAGYGPAVVAGHLMLAGDPDEGLVTALRAAVVQAGEWAPAVRAELLGDLQSVATGDEVAVDQAHALYASGQQERAVEVAARHLAVTTDRGTAATLQTVVLRALVNRADTAAAGRAIDRTLTVAGLPDGVRRQLGQLRCWVRVLAGERTRARAELGPLLEQAVATGDVDVEFGLLTSLAILEYLDARPRDALQLVARQSGLTLSDPAVESRMTALIWPPLFQLYADGVDTATRGSLEARRAGAALGARWLEPFHSFVAAGISTTAGDWDDATVEGDIGLERAEEIGTGWISLAVGERAVLDVRRGHREQAARRLTDLGAAGFPWQFGSPDPALAQLLILEAGGASAEAGAAARELWSTAGVAGPLWMLRAAPDVARVALTGWDPELAQRVADDVARLSVDQTPILAPVVDLVGGMADGSVDRLQAAAAAAEAVRNAPLAAAAHEEVAVAAGAVGASDIARTALDLAVTAYRAMGACTDVDRAAARLRALGVRRGSRAARRVQTGGPASLTETERRVMALVRDGLTNPEIAARLFVSPRTVQTHVSHILAKLGVRSRVEVARIDLPEDV